ncbi:Cullin-3A [Galdieria sulphuraria]|nr:Cullin-3A [Galdieria sulphuraria]
MSRRLGSRVLILPFKHSVQADPKYAERTWDSLKEAIKEICKHNTGVLSYEELYRNAYNLVLHKHGDMLYNGLEECLTELLDQVVKQVAAHAESSFLERVKQEWEWHKVSMVHIRDILMYMDRTYVAAKRKTPVYDLGMALFREVFIKSPLIYERLVNGILGHIQLERKGEEVNRQLMASLIIMLRDLNGEQEGEEIFCDFERRLLKETADFYYGEAQLQLSICSCPVYLKRVEQRLVEEQDRIQNYLVINSPSELIKVVQDELVTRHMETILDMENSGFIHLVRNDCIQDLATMYNLFHQVQGGDELLRSRLKKEIRTQGNIILNDVDNRNDPIRWVEAVIRLRQKYMNIVCHAFGSRQAACTTWSSQVDTWSLETCVDKKLLQTVNDSFEWFLNQFIRTSEYLSLYLDHRIRTDFRNASEAELESCFEQVILLFRAVREKDLFERYYKQHLAKRLLSGRNFSEDIERIFIEKLKSECGYQFTSKLEVMFTDIRTSAEEVEAFRSAMEDLQLSLNGIEFQVNVLTTGCWPIRNQPSARLPLEMQRCCQAFEKVYFARHSGRLLSWQTSLGNVELRAYFPSRRHELMVSTHQAIILLLFNHNDELSFRQIQEETGLPQSELIRCLKSLACGKYRILCKEPKGKEVLDTDMFSFHSKFTCKLVRIKVSNIMAEKETEEEKRETQGRVDDDRKPQIEAAIVRIMKARRYLDHNNLVSEVISQLQTHFVPEPAEIKRRIESLIEREFLERDNNQRSYRYVA